MRIGERQLNPCGSTRYRPDYRGRPPGISPRAYKSACRRALTSFSWRSHQDSGRSVFDPNNGMLVAPVGPPTARTNDSASRAMRQQLRGIRGRADTEQAKLFEIYLTAADRDGKGVDEETRDGFVGCISVLIEPHLKRQFPYCCPLLTISGRILTAIFGYVLRNHPFLRRLRLLQSHDHNQHWVSVGKQNQHRLDPRRRRRSVRPWSTEARVAPARCSRAVVSHPGARDRGVAAPSARSSASISRFPYGRRLRPSGHDTAVACPLMARV